jgi:hypothetical protein
MKLFVLPRQGIGPEITRPALANLTGISDALRLGPTFDTVEIGFAGLATDVPG